MAELTALGMVTTRGMRFSLPKNEMGNPRVKALPESLPQRPHGGRLPILDEKRRLKIQSGPHRKVGGVAGRTSSDSSLPESSWRTEERWRTTISRKSQLERMNDALELIECIIVQPGVGKATCQSERVGETVAPFGQSLVVDA